MDITTSTVNGVIVISVSGSLDGSTYQKAQEEIMKLVSPGCCLVLDLSKCSYISSAGLRVLLMITKQLDSKKGRWAFAGLSDEIKDVMDMTGFSGFFKTFATIEEASAEVKTE